MFYHILLSGPPQITSEVVEVAGVMGQQVEVVAEFCSDPGPIRNTWAWDEVVLPSGNQYGGESKFKVLQFSHEALVR